MWARIALSLVIGARVLIAVCDHCSADSARWERIRVRAGGCSLADDFQQTAVLKGVSSWTSARVDVNSSVSGSVFAPELRDLSEFHEFKASEASDGCFTVTQIFLDADFNIACRRNGKAKLEPLEAQKI